jgi:hypothetical protein
MPNRRSPSDAKPVSCAGQNAEASLLAKALEGDDSLIFDIV